MGQGIGTRNVRPRSNWNDSLAKSTQAERLIVGDEMHLVTPFGEREAQLGGDRSGTAVCRVAGDANLHVNSGSVSELSISG